MPRMDSFRSGTKISRTVEAQYRICIFAFYPPRIPPKQKEEQMENSSPNPSFSICDIRIQKQMSRSFGKSFPQKIVLPKLRPHCSATCPNTWRAEHQRKMSFPLSRKISPPPNQESKEHFSLVLPREARQWRNDTSVRFSFEPPRAPRVRLVGIRIISKIHSNFV
jgi:hypothetical protein